MNLPRKKVWAGSVYERFPINHSVKPALLGANFLSVFKTYPFSLWWADLSGLQNIGARDWGPPVRLWYMMAILTHEVKSDEILVFNSIACYTNDNRTSHAYAERYADQGWSFFKGQDMQLKPPLSFSEQVKLLESRELIVEDKSIAEEFLSRHNYYLLNAYFHKFYDNQDFFVNGTSFNQIVQIFKNDAWLRHQIFSLIEPIEIHLRCHVSYLLATKYGADILYQYDKYENVKLWEENLNKVNREIFRNEKNPVIKHHIKNYNSTFPIWVAIEFFTIGTLSSFFSNLKQADRSKIASDCYDIPDEYLKSWIHSLSVIRNICAHSGYLFRRTIPVAPKKFPEMNWGLPKNSNKLFVFLVIIKRMSHSEAWQQFLKKLIQRDQALSFLTAEDYGFPHDWQAILSN